VSKTYLEESNMAATLTTKGRAGLVERILGSTFSVPSFIAWGVGPGTSAPSDEGLFDEVVVDGRAVGTTSAVTTTTTNDTYQSAGTLTAQYAEVITNVGLFDTGTEPYQSTVQTTVTSSIQSSISVVTPGIGTLPTTPFDIQVLTEVMTVTDIVGNNWSVVRGVNGSTPLNTIVATTPITSISGELFAKADFTGLTLSAGDSIHFIINVQFQ
jgi:hypothetical protein